MTMEESPCTIAARGRSGAQRAPFPVYSVSIVMLSFV
jgi:hypothetical protein